MADTFPRFRELPAEIRLQIWERSLQRRVIKMSPHMWNPDVPCRNIPKFCCCSNDVRFCDLLGSCFGDEDSRDACILHQNLETATLGTFGASFEARRLSKPLQLGQPSKAKPIRVRYELDTIFMNDCIGDVGSGNALLSLRGFGKALLESPDWHHIHHLAMDWRNFHHADYLKGRKRVFTTEILKMRSLKTFTIVGSFTWKSSYTQARRYSKDEIDTLVEMEVSTSVGNAEMSYVRLETLPESLEYAQEKFKVKVKEEWNESVQWVMEKARKAGLAQEIFKVPELRIMTLRLVGDIENHW